jgi:hypothetical protein
VVVRPSKLIQVLPGKTVTSVTFTPYTTSVDVNSGTVCLEERAEMSLINVCVPDESK